MTFFHCWSGLPRALGPRNDELLEPVNAMTVSHREEAAGRRGDPLPKLQL